MASSDILLIFLLLLFHSRAASSSSSAAAGGLFLPLKTQQSPTLNPTDKLYFRHNVSLLVSLSLGSPPQNVTMVLDTGSELSWLFCSNSTAPNATAAGSPFYPRLSSTYTPVPCSSPTCTSRTRDLPSPGFCDPSSARCLVSVAYADGSTCDGPLASDTFRLGTAPPFPAVFGCGGATASTPADAPSGLLGMNRGALSFVTQMGTRRFSYCISPSDSSGVLLLGAGEPPFPLPLNYTPLVNISLPLPYFDRVAYSVRLLGIRVADTLLEIPTSVLVPDHTGAGQTMVDSGTQFTFLLGAAYEVLKAELLRRTAGVLTPLDDPFFVYQGAFDLCYRIPLSANSTDVARALPAVTLVLMGAEVRVEGERLLYRVEGEERGGVDGVWCLTFGNSDLVPLEAFIIGNHHQQNLWVEYDLDNARVGFAAVRCDLASEKLSLLA